MQQRPFAIFGKEQIQITFFNVHIKYISNQFNTFKLTSLPKEHSICFLCIRYECKSNQFFQLGNPIYC